MGKKRMKKPSLSNRSTKKTAKTTHWKSAVATASSASFPIVGIGASAGGLEA
jgi:chemotaxis response regulator CheB